jgi:hypothetical protein
MLMLQGNTERVKKYFNFVDRWFSMRILNMRLRKFTVCGSRVNGYVFVLVLFYHAEVRHELICE